MTEGQNVTEAPVASTPAPAIPTPVTPAPLTETPTLTPVKASTPIPTALPTKVTPSPTSLPTKQPVKSTPLPTAAKTKSPTSSPTASPVKTTLAPVKTTTAPPPPPSPTKTPTLRPTKKGETLSPTSSPSTVPPTSLSPTTSLPTEKPTLSPTKSPIIGTASPTKSPPPSTSRPTLSPTPSPTSPPPTRPPTSRPTVPKGTPTSKPTTASPTSGPEMEVVGPVATAGLKITLTFTEVLSVFDAQRQFATSMEKYVREYYNDKEDDVIQKEVDVMDVDVFVTSYQFGGGRRLEEDRRELQSADAGSGTGGGRVLTLTYRQDMTYSQVVGSGHTSREVVESPFQNRRRRNDYISNYLKPADVDTFDKVQSVSIVEFPDVDPGGGGDDGGDNEGGGDKGGRDTMVIIIAAAAGAVVVIVLIAILCRCGYCRCSGANKKGFEGGGGSGSGGMSGSNGGLSNGGGGGPEGRGAVGGDGFEDEDKPPSQLQLGALGGQDEVSTLAEPTPRLGVMTSNESLAGYGDQSVATVDYDYSKAYGGGGDTSVSSAGGTLGSGTRGGASAAQSGEGTTSTPTASTIHGSTNIVGGTAGAGGGASIFSDEESFEARFNNPAQLKEELIDIYAPPGKLGVVIDTPDDGAPVVHAIKDSSCIADKLKVGDKLVAVDDEDVRSMTAIKVSKMISRKSANPTRKLTVIRTTVAE